MGEYRVITDGRCYWVQFIEGKNKGGNYGPHGRTKEELLAEWTIFNQALHKPVLSVEGKIVEPPLVGKGQ